MMQLSDEARDAIEVWAKGFNALIEDLIAQRNQERSLNLDSTAIWLSKKDKLMKIKEKALGLGPWWWVDAQAEYDTAVGGKKKKRSPKESN
jgi:hypothetical protein